MSLPNIYSKRKLLVNQEVTKCLNKYFHLIKLKPDGKDRILDIGCGDGDTAIDYILKKFPSKKETMMAVDICDDMLSYASKKYENERRVTFRKLDAASTKIPKDMISSFDHVTSTFVLQHIPNQEQVFKNMYQFLKPGGDIFIIFFANFTIYKVYEEMSKTSKKYEQQLKHVERDYFPYSSYDYPEIELKKVMENAGFTVNICESYDSCYVYENFHIFQDLVNAATKFFKYFQTKEEWDAFLKDYLICLDKMQLIKINEETGQVTDNYKMLVAVARKQE